MDIQILEMSIAEAKEKVKLRDDLVSLQNNRAFQRIIQNGFLRDYPAEQVRSLADPVISGDLSKFNEIQREIAGVATLHGYFRRIHQIGTLAEKEIKDAEAELEEIRGSDDQAE